MSWSSTTNVAQFVFQPDEVVTNSFEIFINTPEYQEGIDELESIFENLRGFSWKTKRSKR